MEREQIKELGERYDQDVIVLEPDYLDKAIVGYTDFDGFVHLIYSKDKFIEAMAEGDKCSEEDALEWFEFNTLRSLPYMGSNKPIIIYTEYEEN